MTPDTFDEQAAALREIMDRHHGYGTLWMDALREAYAIGRASGWQAWEKHRNTLAEIIDKLNTMHARMQREPDRFSGYADAVWRIADDIHRAIDAAAPIVTDDQRASVSGERDGRSISNAEVTRWLTLAGMSHAELQRETAYGAHCAECEKSRAIEKLVALVAAPPSTTPNAGRDAMQAVIEWLDCATCGEATLGNQGHRGKHARDVRRAVEAALKGGGE